MSAKNLHKGLEQVNAAQRDLKKNFESCKYYEEDLCLCYLLKAAFLLQLECFDKAKNYLLKLLKKEKEIKTDAYLVPNARIELAGLLLRERRFEEARRLLNYTKHHYKKYPMENRVHFRIHSALARAGEIEIAEMEIEIDDFKKK